MMGPLYFAGSASELQKCIDQVQDIIPDVVWEQVDTSCTIEPNEGAGCPELSRSWNRCLAAIRLMASRYKD